MVMNTELLPTSRVVSTGTIVNDDGKDKKSKFDFEPFRPLTLPCTYVTKSSILRP